MPGVPLVSGLSELLSFTAKWFRPAESISQSGENLREEQIKTAVVLFLAEQFGKWINS